VSVVMLENLVFYLEFVHMSYSLKPEAQPW